MSSALIDLRPLIDEAPGRPTTHGLPPRPIIRWIAEAEKMRDQVSARTAAWFRSFDADPIALVKALRFELRGYDPLTGEPLNLIEQLNQTFTILATVRAVELLLELHPDGNGFRLTLGTGSGCNIESVAPGLVAAQVFSATGAASTRKLKKDMARLAADSARHRYVFFAAPGFAPGRQEFLETLPGIQVYCVEP